MRLNQTESVKKSSLTSKFPSIIEKNIDFIKQHGFAAQHHRRTSVYSCGATISQIREHLLNEIVCLKEHGISLSTIRRLFNVPNKSQPSSESYKGFIDARAGTKSNAYREYHQDAHYLFSRNKYCREFATLFKKLN